MKKTHFSLLALLLVSLCTKAQVIRTVMSKNYAAPTVSSGANAGDAVEVIMDMVNRYAELKCANKLGASLKTEYGKAVAKYKSVVPKGATADFLVVTNAQNCTAINIIHKTQVVRVKDGQCSVNDIKLVEPAIIFDPATTGFFEIKIKF